MRFLETEFFFFSSSSFPFTSEGGSKDVTPGFLILVTSN